MRYGQMDAAICCCTCDVNKMYIEPMSFVFVNSLIKCECNQLNSYQNTQELHLEIIKQCIVHTKNISLRACQPYIEIYGRHTGRLFILYLLDTIYIMHIYPRYDQKYKPPCMPAIHRDIWPTHREASDAFCINNFHTDTLHYITHHAHRYTLYRERAETKNISLPSPAQAIQPTRGGRQNNSKNHKSEWPISQQLMRYGLGKNENQKYKASQHATSSLEYTPPYTHKCVCMAVCIKLHGRAGGYLPVLAFDFTREMLCFQRAQIFQSKG
jgi:hypothetical protein